MKTHLKLTRSLQCLNHNHTEEVIVIAIDTIAKAEPFAIKRNIKDPLVHGFDDEDNIECLTYSSITLKGKDEKTFITVEPPEVIYALIEELWETE